ncbi:Glutamate receptor 4 [Holothuria leucospilota]|uniref:Glutamate receptor 4 n=1 Tax=Holothuria leucospilota TaxID=206669 RepID=A0A9Q1BJS0_HOLLE|nr:Glutamate receptor 4 [Holothuria leucospilota]
MAAGLLTGFICVLLLTSCVQGGGPTQIMIAGFFQTSPNQTSKSFEHAGIWHNVRNNDSTTFQFIAYRMTLDLANSYQIGRSICKTFPDRVSLLCGQTSLSSINFVSSLANAYRTSFVSLSHSKEEAGLLREGTDNDYFVSMRPSLTRVIYDFLDHFGWSKFAYIYKDMEGMQRFYALTRMKEFEQEGYDVVLKRVSTDEETLETMTEIRRMQMKRIIIDVNIQAIDGILDKVNQLGMVTADYHYIITNMDLVKVNLDEFLVGGMNLTGFNLIDRTNPTYSKFMTTWNKERMAKKLEAEPMETESALVFDTIGIFAKTIIGLGNVMDLLRLRNQRRCDQNYKKSEGGVDAIDDHILNSLLDSQVQGLSGNVQFNSNGERTNYTLDILGLTQDGLMKVGEWYSEGESEKRFKWENTWMQVKAPLLTSEENVTNVTQANISNHAATRKLYSKNLFGDKDKVYRITSVLEKPFLMLKEEKSRGEGNERFEGYCMDLLKEITAIFNFTYVIEPESNNVYGNELDDGSWSGMLGDLLALKRAHIAVAPLTITSVREEVIDFTKPYMSLGVSIMIKKPMSSKPDVFSFMQPLSSDIWMCVAFAFMGVSVVLFLVSRFSSQEWFSETIHTNGHRCSLPRPIDDPNALEPMVIEKRMNNFSFSNSIWFSLGALMQQGGDTTPRSLAGRIVGGVWWFFTLILISSYTANLAAFLTVERRESPINSAKDLYESEMEYGILKTGSTFELFRNSNIPLYQNMYNWMKENPQVLKESNEEGIAEVRKRNGKYAFLLESTMNEYESQQKPCDTVMVPQHLDSKGYGIGISKKFEGFDELRDQLTLAILQLREDGTLARLRKNWWFDKGQCQESAKDQPSALKLSNVAGIFYILIIGLGASLVIAIIDFYWKSRTDAQRDKIGIKRAMRNKVRSSVTGERGFRPVPLVLESVNSSGKSLQGEKKDLLKRENGQTDV